MPNRNASAISKAFTLDSLGSIRHLVPSLSPDTPLSPPPPCTPSRPCSSPSSRSLSPSRPFWPRVCTPSSSASGLTTDAGGLGGVLNKRDLAHANLLSERLIARQPAVGAYDASTLAKRAGRKAPKAPKAAKAPKTPKGGPKRPTAAQQIAASALDPYSPNGVFLNSALATSAATRRCGLGPSLNIFISVSLDVD